MGSLASSYCCKNFALEFVKQLSKLPSFYLTDNSQSFDSSLPSSTPVAAAPAGPAQQLGHTNATKDSSAGAAAAVDSSNTTTGENEPKSERSIKRRRLSSSDCINGSVAAAAGQLLSNGGADGAAEAGRPLNTVAVSDAHVNSSSSSAADKSTSFSPSLKAQREHEKKPEGAERRCSSGSTEQRVSKTTVDSTPTSSSTVAAATSSPLTTAEPVSSNLNQRQSDVNEGRKEEPEKVKSKNDDKTQFSSLSGRKSGTCETRSPTGPAGTAPAALDVNAIASAIKETFVSVDSTFLKKHRLNKDGSTAVVAVVLGNSLFSAWVGDSRSVLGSVREIRFSDLLAGTVEKQARNAAGAVEGCNLHYLHNKISKL